MDRAVPLREYNDQALHPSSGEMHQHIDLGMFDGLGCLWSARVKDNQGCNAPGIWTRNVCPLPISVFLGFLSCLPRDTPLDRV